MAGFIIIPACFAYGIEPGAGPSLIFITIPNIFAQVAGGRVWGGLFFLFLSFAAFTTLVAVFENIISFDIDLFGWSRKKSTLVSLILIIILSMPCVMGFNVLAGFTPLGEGSTIMDRITCFRLEVLAMSCFVQRRTDGDGTASLKKSIKEKDGSSRQESRVICLTDCRF